MLFERMPRTRLGKAVAVVGVTALAGVGGQLVFGGNPLKNHAAFSRATAQPERTEHYDANCSVISAEGTTVMPVVRTVQGKKELFRITGYGAKIQFERIENPRQMVQEKWSADPDVIVASSEGIIRTNTVDGTPVVDLTLSDGVQETRAIGHTSPTTVEDSLKPSC